MKHQVKSLFTLAIIFFLLSSKSFADVKLPKLISDGMVLQRDTKLKLWGWANATETVTVTFQTKKFVSIADKDGKWSVTLPPTQAGGPYEILIEGQNQIRLKDILFGDVWICSGQSNMALTMDRVKGKYTDIIANSTNPNIRHFFIPTTYEFSGPKEDLPGSNWISADPKNLLNFSAVAYFFAKDLYEKYKVPVGLINSSVGGSPVEAWMGEEALKPFPNYLAVVEKHKRKEYIDSIRNKENTAISEWFGNIKRSDLGSKKGEKSWNDSTIDLSDWKSIQLPNDFKEVGFNKSGVIWLRKEFDLDESFSGRSGKLYLGRIVDSDSTYLNGKLVGTISYQYPPRIYNIPERLLKKGKNIITVRVIVNVGRGGFIKDKPYSLSIENKEVDLKGEWKYRVGAESGGPTPSSTFFQYKPAGLYNAMIAPLLNCSIKGAIWYQGESNVDRAKEYNSLLSQMIGSWRKNWNQGNFPFLIVQLANLNEAQSLPGESGLAQLREAQLKTLSVSNTALVVTHDIGEWNDIHPLNKADVGKRLALAARKLAYKEDIVYSGPIFSGVSSQGNQLLLSFKNLGSGLATTNGKAPSGFAVAGKDGKFVWAQAKIEKNKVVVWSEEISKPTAVRYAWADNPDKANLSNKEGLPATSFQASTK